MIGLGIDHPPMGRSGQMNQSNGELSPAQAFPRGGRGNKPPNRRPPHLAGPHIVANPPNLAVPLTHSGLLILEKIVNFTPPVVRFKG